MSPSQSQRERRINRGRWTLDDEHLLQEVGIKSLLKRLKETNRDRPKRPASLALSCKPGVRGCWQLAAIRLLALLVLCPALFPASAEGQSPSEPQILIISSYHPGYRWSDAVLEGIRETILPRLPKARLYVEHLDSKRFYSETAFDFLAEMMRVKYQRIRFDALIVSDDNAINFLRKYRWSLFRDIPVVFCGANDAAPARMLEMAPITGINEAADVRATIDLALRLLPATRQIVVVNDTTTTGRKVHQEIGRAARRYQDRVEFIYWEALSFDAILERLTRLTPGSIVLYCFFSRDNKGVFYPYDESAEAVTSASPVPVFGLWEFNLGHGIVGGKLVSGYGQGSAAAEQTLRILAGESPAQIPLVMQSPNRFAFDYRQVQRFGLNMDDLPPGSHIINRPVSQYAQHKALILSVAAALCALTLLSAFLLMAIGKRRRTEAELRASQAFLAGITSNIPGVVYQFYANPKGSYGLTYVSDKAQDIFGIAPVLENYFEYFSRRVHPDDQRAFHDSIDQAVQAVESWRFEGRFVKPTGELIWFRGDAIPHREGTRILFDGVIVDISERIKQAEAQLRRMARIQRHQKALIAMANHTAIVEGDLPGAQRFITELMADALDVRRVGIWMLAQGGEEFTLAHGHDRDAKAASQGERKKIARYPSYFAAQQKDWIIAAEDALSDPRTEELVEDYLKPMGIGALLDAGIFTGDNLAGIICHEHIGGRRPWHRDEISLVRSASEFLARTLMRTERIRAQAQLERSERLRSQIIDFLPDPTFVIDRESRVIAWNRAMVELTGVPEAEILGMGDYAYAIPFYGRRKPILIDLLEHWDSEVAGTYTQIERNGDLLFAESRNRIVATEERCFRSSAGPLLDVEGQVIGAIETVRDITASKIAEVELRKRQEFLESVLYHAPDAIITLDHNYRVVDWNPGAEKMFGYVRNETLGKDLERLISTDDTHRNIARIASRLLAGKRVDAFETVRHRKDGTPIQVIAAGSPIMVEDRLNGVVLMYTDISKIKAAESAIRQRERMLRLVLDTIPVRVFWKDTQCRYLGCNQAFAEDAGKASPEEMVGKDDFSMAWAPEAHAHRKDDLAIMAAGTSRIDYEASLATPNGDRIWLLSSKVPMRDSQNQVIGILGTYQDITERRVAEKEIHRLRNYLANIINSMPSVLVGVDAKGRITQWNTQAERFTGLPFKKVNAQPLEAAVPLFKDEMARIQKAIRDRRVLHDTKVASQEGGENRFHDITIYPLVANGVEGAVIRVDDVTEQVRMEEMMIQSEKMLSVGGLAAGMAHEINNPLAGILQSASVLENRLLGDLPANDRAAQAVGTSMAAIGRYVQRRKLPEMLEGIRSSGDRAAAIVRNMLSFVRKSDRNITPQEMGVLLDQTIELVSTDYDMKKQYDFKRIEIVREYALHAPAVPCEESKIQQVFLNILKNGAEAMAESAKTDRPPQFILRVNDEDQWVRVEIQDNGPGMPESLRKRILEPFFTTKAVGHGTGLGLSVSYFIIVEDHGGKMAVRSEMGNGSCFVIRLPKKRNKE